jgi:heme/copper-type cytochrome/quinol oxidase subunit 2
MRLSRSTVTAEFLQWFGLLGAALAWAGHLVVGFGAVDASCSRGGSQLGLDRDTWVIVATVVACVVVLLAEAAALAVLRETRALDHNDPPPWGRRHFFALAASVANVLFLVAVLLSGIATLHLSSCRQS